MYDYGYTTPDYDTASSLAGGIAAIGAIITILSLVLTIVLIIAQWKIYTKAGKPGWASIIPIYNFIVLLEIVELPKWYILLLLFVPLANIYVMFKIYIELAHKFGKSTGFGIATIFFSIICLPILAFSKDCVYNGNNNNQMNNNFYNPQPQNNNGMNYQNNFNNMQNNMNQQPLFNQNINTEINPIQQPQTNNINYNNQPELNQNNNFMQNNNSFGEQNIIPQPEINSQVEPVQPTMPKAETFGSVNPINTTPQIQETPTNTNISFGQNNNTVEQQQNVITPIENTFKYEIPTQTMEQTNIISTTPNVVENPAPVEQQPQINVIPNMGMTPQPEIQQPNIINNQNNTNMQ